MQIEVKHLVEIQLIQIRQKLKRLNRGCSWEQCIHYLLQTEVNSQAMQSKVESMEYQLRLQKEAFAEERALLQQERLEATEKFLTLSLSRPAAQTMMMAQANPQMIQAPPPPPPMLAPPGPPKKVYIPKLDGDVRNEYVKEIQSVFNGAPVKPSEVLLAVNPKHAEKDMIEIAEDDKEWKEKIPKIWDISKLEKKEMKV